MAYSVNQKGRSEVTVLEDITLNEAEKRTGKATHLGAHFYPFYQRRHQRGAVLRSDEERLNARVYSV